MRTEIVTFACAALVCAALVPVVGLDGTSVQLLPFERETPDPADPSRVSCTIRYWPEALR